MIIIKSSYYCTDNNEYVTYNIKWYSMYLIFKIAKRFINAQNNILYTLNIANT